MNKTFVVSALALLVGVIIGVAGRPLIEPKHQCPEYGVSFQVNNLNDVQFWLQQLSTIKMTDGTGQTIEYNVPGKKVRNPGYILEDSKPLKILDDHGCALLHLLRVDGNKAMLGYLWEIHHPVNIQPANSVSSGVIEIEVERKSP